MNALEKKLEKVSGYGGRRNGAGRVKGGENAVNREFRDTIRMLLEDNAENVSKWLQEVSESNPARALDLLVRLAEFAAPKLTRTEVVGDKDNPLTVQHITRTIVDPITIEQNLKELKTIDKP